MTEVIADRPSELVLFMGTCAGMAIGEQAAGDDTLVTVGLSLAGLASAAVIEHKFISRQWNRLQNLFQHPDDPPSSLET